MHRHVRSALFVLAWLPAVHAAAQPPVILSTSKVRVRADNHFGVAKQHDITVTSFAGAFGDAVVDTEMGTAAIANNTASYDFALSGTTATFDIQSTQSHSVGSTGNLSEGFIQFTLAEPYLYEVSGQWLGTSGDAGDGYQQRTFIRQFVSPFATQYLEDETRIGTVGALYVNQGNDTGGGTFNQFGPGVGVLPAGTYEFNYELETADKDVDQASPMSATGRVRLVLRKPLAPTRLQATVTGSSVLISWLASPDATSYQLEAGTTTGAANLFVGDIGAGTQLPVTVPHGIYFVRLRTKRGALIGPATPELTFTVGTPTCTAPPPAPAGHAVATGGPLVDLVWGSSPGATSYLLEAGTATGIANLASVDLGNRLSFQVTAPPLSLFTRVRAVNACGMSPVSNEAAFTVACVGPPAPGQFRFTRAGGNVTLSWQASLGASSYALAVGTAPGASNLFAGNLGPLTSLTFPANVLPPGIYYFRVAGVGPCGQGPAATELVITLP
ncbi:MAG: fibronectin type III domain-containing protein [Vicinamibacterales bacterium]